MTLREVDVNMDWNKIADKQTIEKTIEALRANGIEAELVETGIDAKKRVLQEVPEGTPVLTMTSVTLEQTGIAEEINESGRYHSIRKKLKGGREEKHLRAAPDVTIGSVHAVTEDGHLIIASATGSQLPAYAYGADKVIWVVGGQKIVKNVEQGLKRIYEYVLRLEDQRARKAYGVGSAVNKLLIINKEEQKGRTHLILVKEKLGF